VRLVPRPPPTGPAPDSALVGECEPGSPYRLSIQAAIWDRKSLLALLGPGESIWEFESRGNLRANEQSTGFYSVWRPVLPYEGRWAHHVIEKGLWFPHEKRNFARADINCDLSRRGTLPRGRTLFYHAARAVEAMLTPLGWRRKEAVKQCLATCCDRSWVPASTASGARIDGEDAGRKAVHQLRAMKMT